ncbi:hypothetical protein ACFP1Z_20540 [Streptomyces gamaensis]|uniref:Uncharacterized protein n=1 Tax=Streptomyces gamaensis TaxID=1763542 RepID=A0ABW0Z1G5_9ACTN
MERTGSQWVIGDPERHCGAHLKLTPEGIRPHAKGAQQELIPWSRFMELSLFVTARRWSSSRTVGALNDFLGSESGEDGIDSHGSCLRGMLRHPYEHWTGRFSHHERRYRTSEILLVDELVRQLTKAQATEQLGNADWLDQAVTRLAPERPGTPSGARRLVSRLLEADFKTAGVPSA